MQLKGLYQKSDTTATRLILGILRKDVKKVVTRTCLAALSTGPTTSGAYFAVYTSINCSSFKPFSLPIWNYVYSSAFAGVVTNLLTNPLWLARLRIQSDLLFGRDKYKTPVQTLRLLMAEGGVPALYKGLSASLIGVSHSMILYPLYELFKASATTETPTAKQMLWLTTVPKVIATLVTYPHEVLRSRLQDQTRGTDFNSLRSVMAYTWHKEGLRGFYHGYSMSLVRMLPVNYVNLFIYELVCLMLS
jgi:solute carrier family 25 folate transporter 32